MIYGDDNIHEAMEKVAGVRRTNRLWAAIQKAEQPSEGLMRAYRRSTAKSMRSMQATKNNSFGGFGGIGDPLSARGKRLMTQAGSEPFRASNLETARRGTRAAHDMGVFRGSENRLNRKLYDLTAGTDARSARLIKAVSKREESLSSPAKKKLTEYQRRGLGHPANPSNIRALVGK